MEALLLGELRSAGPAEIERAGRARLAGLALAAAEAWRQQQAERLEEGLARLDARLTSQLQAELDAVRDAAAELLGLSLAVPGPGDRLAPDLRFFYLEAGQAGQTELLAGTIRQWVPGEAGRRRARAYLHREAASLIPQQIGRARADLQTGWPRPPGSWRRPPRPGTPTAPAGAGAGRGHRQLGRHGRRSHRRDRELASGQQALDHVLTLLGNVAVTMEGGGKAGRS